ncbi:nuclear segregation protein, partial [Macrophomina phaseolina MS6]
QAVKAKLDNAIPSKNGDSPAQKRRQELIAELNEIRAKQGAGKADRNSKAAQLKQLDEQLRRRIADQKAARAKVPFKSVEE